MAFKVFGKIEVGAIPSFCVGCECLFTLCIFFSVISGVDVWRCALAVNSLTGGAFPVSYQASSGLLRTHFGIPSSEILIVCTILSVIANVPKAFCRSFDGDPFAIL